jgi:hypothetical protein
MKEQMQNIQTALLVIIAGTVIYGTFLKNDSTPRDRKRKRAQVTAPAPSPNPVQQPIQNQFNQQTAPQATPVNDPTVMSFAQMKHDFGTIKQHTENEYVFTFSNDGDKPLIIETATGSCGCTVPEFPREPIAPGATGEIRVMYKPGAQEGLQNKTVTVVANTSPRETRLNISANVQKI